MITTERRTHRVTRPEYVLRKPHRATLILFGFLGLMLGLALAWLTGNEVIGAIATHLYIAQEHPPVWAQVPHELSGYQLWGLILGYAGIAWGVMALSPNPTSWSRPLVTSLVGIMLIRYLLWRVFSTLNLADPLSGIFSIALLLMELVVIFSTVIQLYLLLQVKFRNRDADRYEQDVLTQRYYPTVDVLVPTYNEPVEVLRRTIMGCQAMEYDRKTVYLLDDQRRPEMAALAQELGCEYMIRPDNHHAKAGNLNHALTHTSGELVISFDADFVPTTNFITRTIGFFQDETIGMVQTHQSFYTHDPIARNLGLEETLTHEVEIFSRHYQVLRDSIETALCYGSSFVARRTSLERAGGFVINTLSEDYFTSVRLAAQGDRVLYLNERLSAGASADNMADHVAQRLRWARGTLQALFIRANPLTIRGLTPLQRLAHLDGIVQWFGSVFRIAFLLMPFVYSFLGIMPLRITAQEWWYFFAPFYVVQLLTFSWLTNHSRSAILSDIYSIAQCFPVGVVVIQTLIRPFSKGFRVTPKGSTSERFVYNWSLALPLLVVLIMMVASLLQNLRYAFMSEAALMAIFDDPDVMNAMQLAWTWTTYNIVVIVVALQTFLDVPNPDANPWFTIRRHASLSMKHGDAEHTILGITRQLSESGMVLDIPLDDPVLSLLTANRKQGGDPTPIHLYLPDEALTLSGQVSTVDIEKGAASLVIHFSAMSTSQHRQLVELLFCRPGRWQAQRMPGELKAQWFALKSLLNPQFLARRQYHARAMDVAQH